MSNVAPFGPKNGPPDIVAPSNGIVGADGQEVRTVRGAQNDIIQRRNFVLIDCVTGETIVSNGNYLQAYLMLYHTLADLLFNAIHQISGNVAVQVFKKIATEENNPNKQEQPETAENTPE